MENFKSFGRKISIPFLQGYTSITGPNGSGKSNIADAILFVLGPKSSKAIRAGKLTDLIWNGGKDKNASDYCQVSLLFDNGDRQIPVEADEVKLTRYIGLSPSVEGGYNSYFYINDRKSSLSEFDSLLAHARISAEGYNLVQQGDVQKIVSMSSVDRRRILDNIAGITKFDDDITQAEGKRRETEENLERIRIILEEIDKQIKQLEADRDGALKYKDLNGRLTTAKAQLAYKNRELIERQIVGTKEQIGKHEADRAKLEAQKADLRTQLDAAVARLDELEREMAERGGEEAKQLKEKLDGLRIERARATDGTETSKETLKQIRAETADANKERAKVQKETEALARERGTLDTRVAQLAHVEPQYETAVVTAAGARMQAIIVDDDSVAATCIDYLKKRKIGRATFLPLNKMLVGKPRGKAILVAKECLGFAIDLCHFDEKYRDAFFYVFGDTLVVQTLDEARKWMGGVRLVTLEGELIEASGAMIGGDMERSTLKFGAGTANDLEKIAEKLREAQTQAEGVANRLDEIRKAILDLEAQIKDFGGKTGAVEVKTSTLEAKRREFEAKVKSADKDLADRKARFDDARKTATRIEEDLTKFTKGLDALKAKRDERKKAVIEATPQQISSRMKELMGRRATLAEELSGLRSKLEAMATQTAFLDERRGELETRLAALESQRTDHETRIETFQESLGKLENEIRGLEKMEAQMGKKIKDLQDARDAAYKEKTDREGDVDKVSHKIETKEDFLLKMETELRLQEEQLAEAERVMTEMAVEVEEGRLPSLQELKATIGECEAAITALGPINLRALEDYDAQQARAVELNDEFKRLEGQREELINLVTQLTDKKKEGLAKVFVSLNENFQRVYSELSEGGEAELLLENPQDPFLAGLVMKVKPAHKKPLRLE